MEINFDQKEGYLLGLVATSMEQLKVDLPKSEFPTHGDTLDLALDKHLNDVVAMRKWGPITKDELRDFLHGMLDMADNAPPPPPPRKFSKIKLRVLLIICLGIIVLSIYIF